MIATDTQRLTRASLELSAGTARWRRALLPAALLAVPLLAVAGALYLQHPALPVFSVPEASTALEAENATLRAEVERLRAELEMDRATRAALNRQADGLNEQINELKTRLEFLTAREGPVPRSP